MFQFIEDLLDGEQLVPQSSMEKGLRCSGSVCYGCCAFKEEKGEWEKPPKQKSIKELMAVEKTGADLTPEEAERLAAYRRMKADQQRARREGKKSDQPKRKVS